ncbi:hypothetical protein PsorP6_009767 [Peronosclerospora sorghi]|uniref:Uncharacterized protein n=1 Tax=Peronosclerospora sorghi TaxID=230839 RepID=A0ACC0VY93_9STRA|nr:hypothetical protein PsorP6_019613 [Peronosclerospora sorghi]KAI9911439.1 hypothetical protein PsorP6_009767 [Peronosclerospora sorghi]
MRLVLVFFMTAVLLARHHVALSTRTVNGAHDVSPRSTATGDDAQEKRARSLRGVTGAKATNGLEGDARAARWDHVTPSDEVTESRSVAPSTRVLEWIKRIMTRVKAYVRSVASHLQTLSTRADLFKLVRSREFSGMASSIIRKSKS